MRKEVLEIVETLEFWEMRELIAELNNRMANKISRMEAFYKGVDHQVFGMLSTKEQSGFTELGMKQVKHLKELVDNVK